MVAELQPRQEDESGDAEDEFVHGGLHQEHPEVAAHCVYNPIRAGRARCKDHG